MLSVRCWERALSVQWVWATLCCDAQPSHCSGLPRCKHLDFSSCRTWALCLCLTGPGCSSACGIFHDPCTGIKATTPARTGKFSTTRPPGKPPWRFFKLLWVILERRNLVAGISRGISHLPRTIWAGSQLGEEDSTFRNSAFTKSLLSTYWWPQSLCNKSETRWTPCPQWGPIILVETKTQAGHYHTRWKMLQWDRQRYTQERRVA